MTTRFLASRLWVELKSILKRGWSCYANPGCFFLASAVKVNGARRSRNRLVKIDLEKRMGFISIPADINFIDTEINPVLPSYQDLKLM